jgi:hypothetical protein
MDAERSVKWKTTKANNLLLIFRAWFSVLFFCLFASFASNFSFLCSLLKAFRLVNNLVGFDGLICYFVFRIYGDMYGEVGVGGGLCGDF